MFFISFFKLLITCILRLPFVGILTKPPKIAPIGASYRVARIAGLNFLNKLLPCSYYSKRMDLDGVILVMI
jgi:hypothetical protein